MTGRDWWSPRIYEMYGYEDGEIEPGYETFVGMLHPDDRQPVHDHLESHLHHGTVYDVEYRMQTKSGRYCWFRGRGEAIRDENGIPTRMAGSVEMIHQQKMAERKLRREAEINRVILHVMSGFAFVLDPDGTINRSNPAATEVTGYAGPEIDGKKVWELLFPAGSRQRREVIDEIEKMNQGARFFHEMRKIWRKSGSTRTVEYATSGIYDDDGNVLNIVIVGFDLSPHQRLHREVIRMVEQEQIRIGADLHDGVGQLLTGVSDLSEALAKHVKGTQAITLAGKIHMLTRNAIAEVRRMSQGLTPASIENHGLAGSLRILAENVEEQSRIACSISIDQLDDVRDAELVTHLFRIAQEAVNNAVKHSKCNQIDIALRESETETILTIDDNGVGIASTKDGGTRGVGLTVMEYRMALLGGNLSVGNRPEGGTRVECRLRVDFDRLDRMKSGRVFLYHPKLKSLEQEKEGVIEDAIEIVDR